MGNRKIKVGLLIGLFTLVFGMFSFGQVELTLPAEPEEFIAAFSEKLTSSRADKDFAAFVSGFKSVYSNLSPDEQKDFATLTNEYLGRKYKIFPFGHQLALTVMAGVKNAGERGVGISELLKVGLEMVEGYSDRVNIHYLKSMEIFYKNGNLFQTRGSRWRVPEGRVTLSWNKLAGPDGKSMNGYPELALENAQLSFSSQRDCTLIDGTTGKFNLISRKYLGEGGKISWTKLNLDENTVYCNAQKLKLNLNYSSVEIDTVLFSYVGLFKGSLKGRFVDKNTGIRTTSRAVYPYFKSYEGGVVIENFVPNVNYKGGFSLRGVKQIGSSYMEWQEAKEDLLSVEEESEEEEEEELYSEEALEMMYEGFEEFMEYDDADIYSFDEEDGVEEYEDSGDWEEEEEEEEAEEEELEEEAIPVFEGEPFYQPEGMELVEVKAELELLKDGKPLMSIKAREFVLDLEKLVSDAAETTVYLPDGDSIYHPHLRLIYLVEEDKISLLKNTKGYGGSIPFTSSYHNYSLYFEAMEWERVSDSIGFTAVIDKVNKTSAIESKEFYNKGRIRQMRGPMPFNPVVTIARYSLQNPGYEITAKVICDFIKRPQAIDQMKAAIPNLVNSGYIKYDPVSERITPTDKCYLWAKAAAGKKDYDAIQLVSKIESGNNAYLNFQSREMNLSGVGFFSLSDSNHIKVVPFEKNVTVLQDRDLKFGGVVAGGKLNFYGQKPDKFHFEYDNYKILCDSLDSLRFILVRNPPPGFAFSPLQKALRNTSIEGVTGAIYINKPNNKAGLKPHPEYSIFDSYTNSYVYWAKPSIDGGIYEKEKLFFSIDPFVLDSLEIFDESKINFEGEFYSSEIFPLIRQKLQVMDDQTLGMKEVAPEEGYPCYEGKGTFRNEIILDGSGLWGKGELDAIGATAKSDSFEFFFDTVVAITDEFFLPGGERDGANFPEIKATKTKYRWFTKTDEIQLENEDDSPMEMYDGEAVFSGKMTITPGGVKGAGTIKLGNVSVTSNMLIFNESDFLAADGSFTVHDKTDSSTINFIAENVDVKYNVEKHHSTFETTVENTANSYFPSNNYRTSLGSGEYDRASQDLTLTQHVTYKKENYFYSTDPNQDSLNFYASGAKYNMESKKIFIEGVEYIYSADAKIFPDSQNVVVLPSGLLKRLTKARVEANQDTKFHEMTEGTLDVLSANNYTGSATYEYVPVNDQQQFIKMAEIVVDEDSNTVATGEIAEETNFYLTENIFFKGTATLNGPEKFLKFSGFVKIESSNPVFADSWIPFEDVVNPDSVFIKIEEGAKDPRGKLLTVGLNFIPFPRVFYSTFLQAQKSTKDKTIVSASGGLTVNRATGEFIIGPRDKFEGKAYKGATVTYNEKANTITTTGFWNFPQSPANEGTIDVRVSGSLKDDMDKNEFLGDVAMAVNFKQIPKGAFEKLVANVRTMSFVSENVDYSDRFTLECLAEFLDEGKEGEKKTTEVFSKITGTTIPNDAKLSKEIGYDLILSGVDLNYNAEYKALFANGDLDLIGIFGEDIGKKAIGRIEYNFGRISSSGKSKSDTLNLLIEVNEMTWFYFSFTGETVTAISSDMIGFNAELTKALGKKKKDSGFRLEMGSEDQKDAFVSRFIRRYIWKD